MKKNYLIDLILYWLFLSLKQSLQLLPQRFSFLLGGIVLYFISLFYRHREEVAYANLKEAFPHLTPSALKRILRKSVFYLGISFVEFLLASHLKKDYIDKYITVKGKERIDQALQKGKGVIFLTAHYGNWELLSLIGGMLGYPSFALAREQKYPRLNQLLNQQRSQWNCRVIEKGLSTRFLFKALKENKCVGILADQNAGKSGILSKFFSRLVSTPRGFLEIARRCGSVVLPVFLKREGLFRHKLEVHQELDLAQPDQEIMDRYNNILEDYIRQSPQQWLWYHKRWKYCPHQRILVISDGKPGHYRQSLQIAKVLLEKLKKRILEIWPQLHDENLDNYVFIDFIELKVKNPLCQMFLKLFAYISNKRCQGCLKCLRSFLDQDCYKKLVHRKYNYIISTGADTFSPNIILSYENNAKSIFILDPGLFLREKPDLVFIPKHDEKRGKNIVNFYGALVDYDFETIAKYREIFKEKYSIEEDSFIKIGVMIGGDSKYFSLREHYIEDFFTILDHICREWGLRLLITTSRRTPTTIERLTEDYFKAKEYCRLLVIANKENPEGVVPAILGFAHIVIVTSDSVSMIMEAISSGKDVYVLLLNSQKRRNKISRFLKELEIKKFITIFSSPSEVKEGLSFILRQGVKKKQARNINANIIAHAIKRLL